MRIEKENKIKEMSHGKGSQRHMTNNQFVLNPIATKLSSMACP